MRKLRLFVILLITLAALPYPRLALAQSSPEALSEIAHNFLLEQAQSLPGNAQVLIDSSRLQEQAQCQQVQAFLPSGQRLRARLSVGLRCLTPNTWVTSVPASLSVQGFYYVSKRTINPGETLSLDDLIAREGDILRLPSGVLFDPSQIIDYIASQRIQAGNPIRQHALRDPHAIVRGQTVRTVARGTGFVISGEALALQTASPGQQIQVRASSGQVISATVLDASTVQVLM